MANSASAREVLRHFDLDLPTDIYGNGHINTTYLVESTPRYILQRINTEVFKNPGEVMANIQAVTAHLRKKIVQEGGDPERETLTLIPTVDGKSYYRAPDGSCYRLYRFIEGAVSYDAAETPEMFAASAHAFGKFQRMLADFLRRYGADLIVGSHPHVIQPCEYDSTHAVFYSLGNFVSNQRRRYCDGGLLAGVEVTKRIGRSGDSQRRSVAMRYAVQTTPVWVALPDYRILPPEVGDTIALSPFGRAAYERFMADTRELLQKGV